MKIADLRKEYTLAGLSRKDLHKNPIEQFKLWFQQALAATVAEPNAMTLATVNPTGQPSARILLLKGIEEAGFIFYTNYESQKGRELEKNPNAAAVFFWAELERQVRVTGVCSRLPHKDAEGYFHSRPPGSQLAAWVSKQSTVVPNRTFLEERLQEVKKEYGAGHPPMPPYWGGYLLAPLTIEFWQGRPSRLHDRFRYLRQQSGSWAIERLAP